MRKAHFEKAQSKINRKLRVKNLCCNIFVVFLRCTLERRLGGFQHEEEFQECQQFNTDEDLEPPTDDDQLDQVLQTYQAYQTSQSETEMPPRQMNAHITYHVAQAKQAKHGSLVDREQMEVWQVQMSEC